MNSLTRVTLLLHGLQEDDLEDSFKIHSELNPDLFDGLKIHKEVLQALQKLVGEFTHFLGVDLGDAKWVLTGSSANYNWSSYSDIDVHIVVDIDAIEKDLPDNLHGTFMQLFMAKKSLWNLQHQIFIKGYPTELYVEDSKTTGVEGGQFDIKNGVWIKEPKQDQSVIDLPGARKKSLELQTQIETLLNAQPRDDAAIEDLKRHIYDMRSAGLEAGGELSLENLAFKMLRRSGHIDKLWAAETQDYDKSLSLDKDPT